MKKLIPFFVLIAVLAGLYVIFFRNTSKQESSLAIYANEQFGFEFAYPKNYFLEEKEVGNAQRQHYFVSLTLEDPKTLGEGRDGPMAITMDVFQNNLDKTSLIDRKSVV